jgi:hypothetical protein
VTLDQESPGSSPGGATPSAISDYLGWRFAYLQGVCESVSESLSESHFAHLATRPRGVRRGWTRSLERHDRSQRLIIGLLVTLLQGPDVEPPAGCRHVLRGEVLALCGPNSPEHVPETASGFLELAPPEGLLEPELA